MRITTRDLRRWFEEAVDADYYEWKAKARTPRNAGIRYRGMISRYGHVKASIKLMRSESNTRHVNKHPTKIGLEFIIDRTEFRPLFPDDVLKEARRRIRQYDKATS